MMYKLCHYLKLPVTLVFVFDGPARPAMKRGRKVITKAAWYLELLQRLIESFGFYSHQVRSSVLHFHVLNFIQAPGEAEAELAVLNSQGFIDSIITDDGDALIFGAKHLLRVERSATSSESIFFDSPKVYLVSKTRHSEM